MLLAALPFGGLFATEVNLGRLETLAVDKVLYDEYDKPLAVITSDILISDWELVADTIQDINFSVDANSPVSVKILGKIVNPGETVSLEFDVAPFGGKLYIPIAAGSKGSVGVAKWTLDIPDIRSLDTRPPVLTISNTASYTNQSTVNVKGTGIDGETGVKSLSINGVSYPLVGDDWSNTFELVKDVDNKFDVVLTDNADNIDTGTYTIYYDATNPSLSIDNTDQYTIHETFDLTGTASDFGTGINSIEVNGQNVAFNNGLWGLYNLNITADTRQNYNVVATDNSGRSSTKSYSIHRDATDPVLAILTKQRYTSSPSFDLYGTSSDSDSGLKNITVNGEVANLSFNNWSLDNIPLTANADNTLEVVSTDNVGNETRQSYLIYRDSINPTVSFSNNALFTRASNITAYGLADDKQSGIAEVLVDDIPAVYSDGTWSVSNVPLINDSSNKLTVVAIDKSGREHTDTFTIFRDSTPPILTINNSENYTSNNSVTLAGDVSDSGLGVKSVTINGGAATLSGNTWSLAFDNLNSNVDNLFTVIATDLAGGTTTKTYSLFSDTVKPNLLVANTAVYTQQSKLDISGTVTDTGSGVKSVTVNDVLSNISGSNWSAPNLPLTPNTSNLFTIVAEDNVGRKFTETYTIFSDTVNPSLSIKNSAKFTRDLTVDLSGTVSDSESGIAHVKVNGVDASISGSTWTLNSQFLTANTDKTFSVVATDKSGRQTTTSYTVYSDRTNPSISINNTASNTTGEVVNLTGTVSDNGSGVSSVKYGSKVATLSGGNWSIKNVALSSNSSNVLTVVATDNSGRTSSASYTVYRDSAAPSLTINNSDAFTGAYSVMIHGTASDIGSGLSGVTVNGSNVNVSNGNWSTPYKALSANTNNTFTVIATDKSGRTTTKYYNLFRDGLNPTLTVPADKVLNSSGSVKLSGVVSDSGSGVARVKVNNSSAGVSVASNGTWSKYVIPAEGKKIYTVEATDNVGWSISKSFSVTLSSAPKVSVSCIPSNCLDIDISRYVATAEVDVRVSASCGSSCIVTIDGQETLKRSYTETCSFKTIPNKNFVKDVVVVVTDRNSGKTTKVNKGIRLTCDVLDVGHQEMY